MAKNRGLGQGLNALMKANVIEEVENLTLSNQAEDNIAAGFVELSIDKIHPNPNQPRRDFDEEALGNLAQSIKNFGLIQPITVIKQDSSKYEIVAGERRYRASKMIGLNKVPVIIKNLSKKEQFELSVIENIQREDLNPIEISVAYSSLIETYNITQEELGTRLGKSRTAVTNSLRLLKLDPQIQKWIINGSISPGHARAILSIENAGDRISLAHYIIHNNLSVREAEKLAKKWPPQQKEKKEKKSKEAEIQVVEEKISQKLQTKVSINGTSSKGKIQIEYFNLEELERLMDFFQVSVE